MTECTGVAASWCPVHGDCSCPRGEDGEIEWHYEAGYVAYGYSTAWSETAKMIHEYAPDCPLHAITSNHADEPWMREARGV